MRFEEAMKLLEEYEIPVPPYLITDSFGEAAKFAMKHFPIALKVATFEHKSEKGFVILNIENEKQFRRAWDRLKDEGELVVQKMIDSDFEFIIGGKMDKFFGPVMILGIGGVYAELFSSFSTRLVPISPYDGEEMISELGVEKLFTGFRGKKLKKEKLLDVLLNFSRMMEDNHFSEVDINPLIGNEHGFYAVDVRIVE